jgi:peroxiredoxin
LTARIVREPSSVRRQRILLRGDDLLRQSLEHDGETWSFLGGVWTQYVPKSQTAWLRLPDQMPGLFPLDPRNVGSLEQRWLFVDRLREDRVLEAGPTRTGDGQLRMSVLLEHAFDKEHAERYRCDFDPARNDLPTRIVVFRQGNGIGIVLDIAYRELIPGAAWFLEKSTLKFFGPELARSPDSEAWRQAVIVEATGEVQINGEVDDDELVVKLPEGTRVSDSVHRSIYVSGERSRPDEFTRLRVGDAAPDFEATTLEGETVRLSRLRGKVVLIHFFATWCGPCVAELPRIENEVWRRFREKGLVVLAVGREHTVAELVGFRKEHELTLPMAGDPRRETYERFAEQGVPRNYVIDARGKVVYQSVGYTDPRFNELVKSVEAATDPGD